MSPLFVAEFWMRVEEMPSRCWEWRGSRNPEGYGHVSLDGKWVGVHRVAFALFHGPIPDGLTIDHLCRNTGCVNPKHLEAVSMRENILRGTSFGAINAAKDTCCNGHPFTRENTYLYKGTRNCRACNRERAAAYKARQRQTTP